MNKARISVFGLGYVGTVSAACFAKRGHDVVGVDSNPAKVQQINQGLAPIVEEDVPELIGEAVAGGQLRATADVAEAIAASDISLVCVGTPSLRDGALDLSAVVRVCEEIGAALRDKDGEHLVVMRSTMLPGSMRGTVVPALERASGKRTGDGLLICNNPEFLRESTAVYDFYNPPKTVIGGGERECTMAAALYDGIEAPLILTSMETAEMVKYADNCWHAVKVTFGNEIGNICQAVGVDSHAVMDIFLHDRKLNISPTYLRPGFAFGGSCLPKDLRALTAKGRQLALPLPLLESVLPSNRSQIERAVEMIVSKGRKRIGFLGFSFKSGTDDLRESPQVEVIERLIGKGYDLKLYDRNVQVAGLTGRNKAFIADAIPHLSRLMTTSLEEAVDHGELVIVGNSDPAFSAIPSMLREDQLLIDFVRLPGTESLGARYVGINW